MLNLPRAVQRGGAGNARATSCFAGAGDGLASKLQRLREGRPDSFLSLAELAREEGDEHQGNGHVEDEEVVVLVLGPWVVPCKAGIIEI